MDGYGSNFGLKYCYEAFGIDISFFFRSLFLPETSVPSQPKFETVGWLVVGRGKSATAGFLILAPGALVDRAAVDFMRLGRFTSANTSACDAIIVGSDWVQTASHTVQTDSSTVQTSSKKFQTGSTGSDSVQTGSTRFRLVQTLFRLFQAQFRMQALFRLVQTCRREARSAAPAEAAAAAKALITPSKDSKAV